MSLLFFLGLQCKFLVEFWGLYVRSQSAAMACVVHPHFSRAHRTCVVLPCFHSARTQLVYMTAPPGPPASLVIAAVARSAPPPPPLPPPPPQAATVNRNANRTAIRLVRLANRVIIFIPCCPLYSRSYSVIWPSLILRRLPIESISELSTFYSLSRHDLKTR